MEASSTKSKVAQVDAVEDWMTNAKWLGFPLFQLFPLW